MKTKSIKSLIITIIKILQREHSDMARSDPERLAERLLPEVVFRHDPLGRPVIKPSLKELDDLTVQAMPEIERLYAASIKRGLASTREQENCREVWMTATLAAYDAGGYKYVKREYLEDRHLYNLNERQEPRDFETRLLKMVLRGTFKVKRVSALKLWKRYKEKASKENKPTEGDK